MAEPVEATGARGSGRPFDKLRDRSRDGAAREVAEPVEATGARGPGAALRQAQGPLAGLKGPRAL
ncbi:hypothetical protein CHE218_13250 [Microbacterium sp. che218]